jgi:hypothetical protein
MFGSQLRCKVCNQYTPDRCTCKPENHGLDTDQAVLFYEQDFYPLSNFSSFTLQWKGIRFDTSEAAYHWEKFEDLSLKEEIRFAPSAHEAFKAAERYKPQRRADWDAVKVDIMRDILRAKLTQHEYVRRKLLATGDRELIENSWRDDFWGWGPNKGGQNQLGKLWMELRTELRNFKGRYSTEAFQPVKLDPAAVVDHRVVAYNCCPKHMGIPFEITVQVAHTTRMTCPHCEKENREGWGA